MTFISGSSNSSSSSSTSSSIIIIIIIISSSSINNIFVLLLYQPLFLRVSYVSCCFASIYPTTNFLRDHNGKKLHNFFVLSLPSHLMEKFFYQNFQFIFVFVFLFEFIFAYVVNIRFTCDGKIYLLTYLLIYF